MKLERLNTYLFIVITTCLFSCANCDDSSLSYDTTTIHNSTKSNVTIIFGPHDLDVYLPPQKEILAGEEYVVRDRVTITVLKGENDDVEMTPDCPTDIFSCGEDCSIEITEEDL